MENLGERDENRQAALLGYIEAIGRRLDRPVPVAAKTPRVAELLQHQGLVGLILVLPRQRQSLAEVVFRLGKLTDEGTNAGVAGDRVYHLAHVAEPAQHADAALEKADAAHWLRGEQSDSAEHAIGASKLLIVVEMRRVGQDGLEFRDRAARVAAPVVHSPQPIVAVRNQATVAERGGVGQRLAHHLDMLLARCELGRSRPFEADLDTSAALVAFREQMDGSGEMIAGGFESEGLDGAVPCQLEIAHGAVEVVVARVVKGQGLAIFLGPAARQLLDGLRHQSVQLLALLEQQSLVRNVLDDDVLESEARLRLTPNRGDETELLELRDDPVEIDIRSDEAGEDRQRELTPNDGGAAQDISPGRLEPVEPSQHRALHRVGNADGRHWLRERELAILDPDQAFVLERTKDLLDEQWVSAGALVQHGGKRLGRRGNVEHRADHRRDCVRLERPQAEGREMLVDGPRHLRARPECHDDENRERRNMPEMVAEELVGGLIRPMPVFQLQDEGTAVGAAPDQRQQSLPEYLAARRPTRDRRQGVLGIGRRQKVTQGRRMP